MKIELTVYEPSSLFAEGAMPEGVWLRAIKPTAMCWMIEARGPRKAIERFVRDHWGDDEWEDRDESVPWLARPRSRFRLWRQARRLV